MHQMRTAIITGASSGMGMQFLMQMDAHLQVDEVIVVARREDRLKELQNYTKAKVVPLPLDLTDPSAVPALKEFLKKRDPDVRLLVNAAGFGKFEPFAEGDPDVHRRMVDLNCRALQDVTYAVLPYMSDGSKIVQFGSMSAFQPVPYIGLYGATKAFVLSFTRALNAELRGTGIRALCLCPYWVKTDFFDVAGGSEYVHNFPVMYQPDFIVRKCYETIEKHPKKDVCVPGFLAKGQRFLVKILPHGMIMRIWLRQQGLKPEKINEKKETAGTADIQKEQ